MFNDRDSIRQTFFTAWHKHERQESLSPLEQQIVVLIKQHPEYHAELTNSTTAQENYRTDNNPFLHLGLHLGLQEQLQTNRPAGITTVYEDLCMRYNDPHQAQHYMMEVMARLLWEAQQKGQWPDEAAYLANLRSL